MNPSIAYWLAALYLPNVGPRTFARWLEQFTDIYALFSATTEEWMAAEIPPKYWEALKQPDLRSVEKDLLWAQDSNHHLITLSDEHYPRLLKEITDPPLVLYVKGNANILSQPQIAMVGSRHASVGGVHNAEQFAKALAASGLVVTSGLALGVDAAAHRGALAAKGRTLAVAGTGLECLYPKSHLKLAQEIVDNQGALVSEFPLRTPPHAANFPRRNRIISGLSTGVLVVEAALKSGSLITARHAIEQGREVFAIPGSIHQPLARGCHYLIRQGAKLVERASDILEELGFLCQATLPKVDNLVSVPILDSTQSDLLERIEYEITPLDVIILRSGLTPSEVSSILLTLELNGYVQVVTGGYIRVGLTGSRNA